MRIAPLIDLINAQYFHRISVVCADKEQSQIVTITASIEDGFHGRNSVDQYQHW